MRKLFVLTLLASACISEPVGTPALEGDGVPLDSRDGDLVPGAGKPMAAGVCAKCEPPKSESQPEQTGSGDGGGTVPTEPADSDGGGTVPTEPADSDGGGTVPTASPDHERR